MFKFLKRKFKLILLIVIILAIAGGAYSYIAKSKSAKKTMKFSEQTVTRKNLQVTISGSGTVVSSTKEDITPKADGNSTSGIVKKVYFKEGDKVKKGDVIIQMDDIDARTALAKALTNLKQSETNLQNTRTDIANLAVPAPISGQVSGIQINQGDDINKGMQVCTITDTSKLTLTVPFNKLQIKSFYVGESADIYLQDYMQIVNGKVKYIDRNGQMTSNGGVQYSVEISIDNPGAIKAGVKAGARIAGETSIDSAAIENKSSRVVKALSGGTVLSINVKENQFVSAGQSLAALEGRDLLTQLESAQIKVQDAKTDVETQTEKVENCKVIAPEDGEIVALSANEGDTVKTADVVATIADYGKMEFNIDVDELDIAKIKTGMKASVTIDALPSKTFEGVVKKVANEGTSNNGVATYPVTVQILNPESIKDGMNANAEIIVQEKDNVLTLPISAIQKMGRQSIVFVKGASSAGTNEQMARGKRQQGNAAAAGNFQQSAVQGNNTPNGAGWQNGSLGSEGNGTGNNSRNNSQGRSNSRNNRMQSMMKNLGTDVTMKRIEVGINNDDDIEIVSGLNEGDTVVVPVTTSSTTATTAAQGAMFGGMGGQMGGMGGGGNFVRIQNGNSSSGSRNNSGSSNRSGGGSRGND